MEAESPGLVAYLIGPDDRILAVDRAWDDAARREGLPELTGERIIGRPLRDFIADAPTAEVFRMLFAAARKSQRTFTGPFRCDTPTLRRKMMLSIVPKPDGTLRIVSSITAIEARPAVGLIDLDAERSNELLRICGWCKRIPVADGNWAEVEEAVRALPELQRSRMPRLSHGLCPDCADRMDREIQSLTAG